MEIGRVALEHQAAAHLRRGPKPPEEQKYVANADTTVLEVGLSGIDLPERRPPTGRPRPGLLLQVGIQVHAVVGADPLPRDRRDDF
jgi:hypothetical protein